MDDYRIQVKEYMQNRIENSGHRYKRKVVRGEK
jgi:hypothetical protein